MGTDGVVHHTEDLARDAGDHPAVRAAARLGYIASGVIHMLIAWLALRLATGGARSNVDQSAALGVLADSSWGRPVLWVLTVGFVGLALWQLTEAIGGRHGRGGSALAGRVKAIAKTVVYVVLAWLSAAFARGIRSDGRSQSVETTGDVLAWPGGEFIVGVGALVVLGVGIYHVVKGLRQGFRRDLVQDPGPVAVAAGRIGYVAKGIALVVVGGLMGLAAYTQQESASSGLGGAMSWILSQPFGPWLLGIVAVGIGCYGVYSFFRARYTVV